MMTTLVYAVALLLGAAVIGPPLVIELPYWIRPGGEHAQTPRRHVPGVGLLGSIRTVAAVAPAPACLPEVIGLIPAGADPTATAERLTPEPLSATYSDSALPPDRQPDARAWGAWWPVGGREPRTHVCDGKCLCFADETHDCPVCNPIRERTNRNITDNRTKVDN